jgi:hypothetical protein
MKKRKPFADLYPYIDYWINDWGEMETTNGNWGRSRLMLIDEGGTAYQDEGSKSHDEALVKAEKFLRTVWGPDCFDKETIVALEEEYQALGLS